MGIVASLTDHPHGLFLLAFLYSVCMFFNFCIAIAIRLP